MAMRPDILPEEYCMELMKLLDDAPPFKDKVAIELIEKELGKDIDILFKSFDMKHIAAASFGQVYKAVLLSGDKVVVKVLRPGIQPIVYAELAFFKLLTRILDFSCILGSFKLTPYISDFLIYTKEELNYLQEAKYITKIYDSSVNNPLARIPRVYEQFTTSKILTIEYLDGVWMKEILIALRTNHWEKLDEYKSKGIDITTVAKNLLLNSLIQTFERTYFHADPHAANLCIMDNNVIGYVDFGIVGKIDKKFREANLTYVGALFKEEIDKAYMTHLEFIQPPTNIDLTGFEKEMKEVMADWLEALNDPRATLKERSALRRMFKEGKIMRKYNIIYPEITSRYFRLMMISDIIVFQLAPSLDVVGITSRYLRKLSIKTWKEKIAAQNLEEILVESLYGLITMPKRIDTILTRIETLGRISGKVVKNLRRVPSAILNFFGKFGLILSLVGFIVRFIFNVNFQYQLLNRHFDLMDISLRLLVGSLVLLWLSRYLISRR